MSLTKESFKEMEINSEERGYSMEDVKDKVYCCDCDNLYLMDSIKQKRKHYYCPSGHKVTG